MDVQYPGLMPSLRAITSQWHAVNEPGLSRGRQGLPSTWLRYSVLAAGAWEADRTCSAHAFYKYRTAQVKII